jgi:transcriptional regulator with XRE-family HTH domain
VRPLVARRIEEVRTRRKMSREDLAKRLRTTRMRIWRLENGVTEVSAEVLQRIADELGTRVENFYRESGAS